MIMTEFEKWDYAFRNQDLNAFNENFYGLLWLKVRAICRGKQLQQFIEENNIILKTTKVSARNVELYDILKKRPDAMSMLDAFLQCMNHEWYTQMGVDVEQLKEDLYKIKYYSWGGDQNNSLDKYFISRYVKVISNYNELQSKQPEIGANAWDYVQNSWYNNWTSFIIESLFKRNPGVISAVGEIKSVDFFIQNYPFDLKVTFFPNQFMEQMVKSILGKGSLSWLKTRCKEIGIKSTSISPNQQAYILTEKLKEINNTAIIDELNSVRRKIIEESQSNPYELIRWLYENQGEMRFGAENRIYLILADSINFDQSWKLKRAFSLIEPKINDFIKNFSPRNLKEIHFEYKKKAYKALSDVIFVIK